MTRRGPLAAALALTVVMTATPAAAQDVISDPVFISGPVEWAPRVALTEFGFDNNVFLENEEAALADITGTLTPSLGAQITTPRWEVRTSATVDLVYFERYVEQRALNQSYAGRAAFTVSLFQPFVAGEWEDVRDRRSPEVDIRARRRSLTTTAGLGLFSLSRASLTLAVSRGSVAYAIGQTFDGVSLARELNRDSESATVGFNFTLTPLTSFTASASVLRDRYLLVQGKDQRNETASIGISFTPDAALRGHASVGYARLTVEDPGAIPYEGFTTDVDITYALLDVTRLTARYTRATAASVNEPYYLQTLYGGELQQSFLGPTDLVVRASRQLLDYPGLPSRGIVGHLDFINSIAAGVIVRLSGNSAIDVTYEIAERVAQDPNQGFDRRRIITSVSLGF